MQPLFFSLSRSSLAVKTLCSMFGCILGNLKKKDWIIKGPFLVGYPLERVQFLGSSLHLFGTS